MPATFNGGELTMALKGVAAILGRRPEAFGYFDASPRGFWRSFRLAIALFPVWALVLADQLPRMQVDRPLRYCAFQAVGYAISWLAYPLAMVPISDYLDRWPRYYTYMVAYNWFQIVQMLVWVPLLLLVDLEASRGLIAALWLGTHAFLLVYAWFMVRRGLDVDAGAATALVVIDLLLGQIIDRMSAALV